MKNLVKTLSLATVIATASMAAQATAQFATQYGPNPDAVDTFPAQVQYEGSKQANTYQAHYQIRDAEDNDFTFSNQGNSSNTQGNTYQAHYYIHD